MSMWRYKMTSKQYFIKKNVKPFNTRPEQLFNEYQESRHLDLVQNIRLPFTHDGKLFIFQLDFARKSKDTFDIDFEIDGQGHKEKWDRWKDRIKNKHGLKVIHIDARLCEKRFWNYLDQKINEAVLSKEGVVYIYG